MLEKLFIEHPRSVGESYGEHLGSASGFGFALISAGLACILHGLVPALFRTTGSDAVCRLHAAMQAKRARMGAQTRQAA